MSVDGLKPGWMNMDKNDALCSLLVCAVSIVGITLFSQYDRTVRITSTGHRDKRVIFHCDDCLITYSMIIGVERANKVFFAFSVCMS